MCTNGQRHELGEAAGARLQFAHAQQMPRPVPVAVDVAEHDGRRASEADVVRGLHHLEPLGGGDLVRAQDRAHLVIEDFGRRARKAAEARPP